MAQNSYDGQYFVDDIVSVKPKYPKLFNVYGTSCISDFERCLKNL